MKRQPLLSSGCLFCLWKRQVWLQTEQVIGGDMEETAKRYDIINGRFTGAAFNIGNLALRHSGFCAKLCLIQVRILS